MLKVVPLMAHLRFTSPVLLPFWLGSAFRGGVGMQLREVYCPTPERTCDDCAPQETCVYYTLYENKRQKNRMWSAAQERHRWSALLFDHCEL